ncbi:MAG: hypothetical protein ABWK53_00605 [Anaerolineales bacterium]
MSKFKLVCAALVAFLPFNWLRVWGYRLFFGYQIEGAKIGWGTILGVTSARLGRCQIGYLNQFVGPMTLTIADGVKIGDQNRFVCGFWTLEHGQEYARCLTIGENARITSSHYFDVCGALEIGAGSWIAGIGSQFWTHGAGIARRYVKIGKDCYLGSAVCFGPGAVIEDGVMVALGSVVTRKFAGNHLLLGGAPASVVMSHYDWKSRQG